MSKNKNEVLIDCFILCKEIMEEVDVPFYIFDRAESLSKKLMEFGIKEPDC